jgi:hypothetical protein
MLFLPALLVFPAMAVSVNENEHEDGQGHGGKNDHGWPVLPDLAQQLEAVMDHDSHTLHRAAANPNSRVSILSAGEFCPCSRSQFRL